MARRRVNAPKAPKVTTARRASPNGLAKAAKQRELLRKRRLAAFVENIRRSQSISTLRASTRQKTKPVLTTGQAVLKKQERKLQPIISTTPALVRSETKTELGKQRSQSIENITKRIRCKERPQPKPKAKGGGSGKEFAPWCKK